MPTRRIEVETPSGVAGVDLVQPSAGQRRPRLLVLGHGAGGSVDAPDLQAVTRHCVAAGISVALVTQPYRVLGRKAPPAPAILDAAWAAVVTALGRRRISPRPELIFGGRSSGARVACRTAADPSLKPQPIAVVTLAFPVHPPGRPDKSRLDELDAVAVPTLVIQGESDPFGVPPESAGRTRVVLPGDHGLKRSADAAGRAVADWLTVLD